jgi:hypothetical protein
MRGHECVSKPRRASGLNLAANRRTGAPFDGLLELSDYTEAVFEGPQLIYPVLHVLIGGFG